MFKKILPATTIIALGAPLSALLAIATFPFWVWAESVFSIEIVGHSGPNAAVYVGLYALYLTLVGLMYLIRRNKQKISAT